MTISKLVTIDSPLSPEGLGDLVSRFHLGLTSAPSRVILKISQLVADFLHLLRLHPKPQNPRFFAFPKGMVSVLKRSYNFGAGSIAVT